MSWNPQSILAKYSNDGDLQWHERFGPAISGATLGAVLSNSLCVDLDENVYLSGYFNDSVRIADTIISTIGVNSEGNFLCKFDSTGGLQWLTTYYNGDLGFEIKYNKHSDQINMLGVIGSNNLIIGADTIIHPGYYNTIIARFNAINGDLVGYTIYPGGPSFQNSSFAQNFDISDDGDVYFASHLTNDTIIYMDDTLASNGQDFFLWKIKADGSLIWRQQFGGTQNQEAKELCINANEDIFINTWASEVIVHDEDTLWEFDVFKSGIMKLDSTGSVKAIIARIGADSSIYKPKSMAALGSDLIIHGQEYVSSGWQDHDFLGRYHFNNIGIEEVNPINDNAVLVYPNPASSQLKIESSFTISQISVYSITGQFVKEQAVNGKMVSLNVSDLLPGNYIVRCVGDQQDFARKIVVLR